MRILKTSEDYTMKVLSFSDLCENKTNFPIIQRGIVVKPEDVEWLIDEVFSEVKDRELGMPESVIKLGAFYLYEDSEGITSVFDGQQRSLCLLCMLKALNDVYPDKNFKLPDISFEKLSMQRAWKSFTTGEKVLKDKETEEFSKTLNSLYNYFYKVFDSEMKRLSEKRKKTFAETVKIVIYECKVHGMYAPTYEEAIQDFINTNSGGKQMASNDFCRAYLIDAAEKLGVTEFEPDTHTDYCASATQTFYRLNTKSNEIKTFKINQLRTITEKYIACSAESFRAFNAFLNALSVASKTNEYRFVDAFINRNDFTQLYQLAIANQRKIDTEFVNEVLLKLAYMSLAASINQTRGSYFTSLISALTHDLNNNATNKKMSGTIVNWIEKKENKPTTITKEEFTEKLNTNTNKVKALSLYITSIIENKQLSVVVDETDLEHLVANSNKQFESQGFTMNENCKKSIGNLYLIPLKCNRATKNNLPWDKIPVYDSKIPASYKFESNSFADDIRNARTQEELINATNARTERVVDVVIKNPFFNSHYVK